MIESRLIAHAQTRNRTLYQHSHPQLLLSLEEGSSLALPALQRDKPGNALTDLHRQRQELTVLVIFSLSDGTGMLKTFYSSTGGASALQGQVGPPFSEVLNFPNAVLIVLWRVEVFVDRFGLLFLILLGLLLLQHLSSFREACQVSKA